MDGRNSPAVLKDSRDETEGIEGFGVVSRTRYSSSSSVLVLTFLPYVILRITPVSHSRTQTSSSEDGLAVSFGRWAEWSGMGGSRYHICRSWVLDLYVCDTKGSLTQMEYSPISSRLFVQISHLTRTCVYSGGISCFSSFWIMTHGS
jgi:hypothetical protein